MCNDHYRYEAQNQTLVKFVKPNTQTICFIKGIPTKRFSNFKVERTLEVCRIFSPRRIHRFSFPFLNSPAFRNAGLTANSLTNVSVALKFLNNIKSSAINYPNRILQASNRNASAQNEKRT